MDSGEIVGVVGVCIAALSLIVAFYTARQSGKQIKELQEAVELFRAVALTFEDEVQSLRKEVELIKSRSNLDEDQLIKAEIEKQKIAQRERELQWRKMRDLGKAWKWINEG